MGIRTRALSAVADQLGNPHGVLGKGVAVILNRGNGRSIAAAVDAAEVAKGATAADIGFGGGAGLPLLLNRVGPDGSVHGIELSPDMLAHARRRYAAEIAADRLRITAGSLTELPLADASLDAAITVNTIYFIDDLDSVCAELVRVIRPGGRLVVGIGDPEVMARMPFAPYGNITLRPVPEVIAALEKTGCTVEHRRLPVPPIPHNLLIALPK
ncbi:MULTISPECIES: class I SAM-dependent methyltransferase [unclassified Nocardia]|uniref:class I SAM-dependent methyltransferase n=1 Tax=unclassified Nocardia TaxID=2637762 RepID=UPI001CE42525|nr:MULTISPECIES: methyltransferase domain-containing protein [unclassified Nocardia]